jgi:hypothetical protein
MKAQGECERKANQASAPASKNMAGIPQGKVKAAKALRSRLCEELFTNQSPEKMSEV